MIVVGLILSGDFLMKAYQVFIFGFVLLGVGVYALLNGIIGIFGGCKENFKLVRTNMYLSIGQVILGLSALGFVFACMKKEDKLLAGWSKMSDDRRMLVESKLHCCGYEDTKEAATPDCKSTKSCDKFVPLQYKKKITMGGALAAGGLLAGAFNLFGVFCLQKKMRKQKVSENRKMFASLADESRGITRKEREKMDRAKRAKIQQRTSGADGNV